MTLTGTITEFPIPTPNAEIGPCVVGLDTKLWCPEYQTDKIALVAVDGTITEVLTPPGRTPPP